MISDFDFEKVFEFIVLIVVSCWKHTFQGLATAKPYHLKFFFFGNYN